MSNSNSTASPQANPPKTSFFKRAELFFKPISNKFKGTNINSLKKQKKEMEERHKKEQHNFKGIVNYNPNYDKLLKRQREELNNLKNKITLQEQKELEEALQNRVNNSYAGGYKRRTKRNKRNKRKNKTRK